MRCLDLEGRVFYRWTVKKFSGRGKWECQCDCGNTALVLGGNLVSGRSKSCGCLKSEVVSKRCKGISIKPTLYVLPYGIEVTAEYPPRGQNVYWRIRIRPHPFFSDSKITGGGIMVRRSRAVMASKTGRALLRSEHVHHKDENRGNDATDNLILLSSSDHNRHHKLGEKHTKESRARIALSLKKAYDEKRHGRTVITERDHMGRIKSCKTIQL